MITSERLKLLIEESIQETITKYQKSWRDGRNLIFIMESDIQGYLYSVMLKKIENDGVLFPIARHISAIVENQWNDNTIGSILLHCEMPLRNNRRRHFDIGIWDIAYKDEAHENDVEYYKFKKVKYAIEIKYNWDKQLNSKILEAVVNDFEKVSTYRSRNNLQTVGYFLVFLSRSMNVANEKERWKEFLLNYRNTNYYDCFLQNGDYLYIISPDQYILLPEKDSHAP
ncbi:MAG: hypothetical protein ABIL44_12690 [candidate division WOR-3 bacterium]